MYKIPSLLLFMALIFACQPKTDSSDSSEEADVQEEVSAEPIVYQSNGITLTEVSSLEFPDAQLTLNSPAEGSALAKNPVVFDFGVSGYDLGTQTGDAGIKLCANSAQGQHIHLILNNAPYTAHYEGAFTQDVEDGSYVALAFLSRSYHESIKTDQAYKLFGFTKGEGVKAAAFDYEAPHLFYSRPKGNYVGEDVKKVLLDFYLVNTDLAKDGMKVKAVINGTEFTLDKWVPYAMEGLPMGENTIELTLVDADGNIVVSPFNPVTRKVTLEPAEE